MKKFICIFFVCVFLSITVLAQPVSPPQTNQPQSFMFILVAILLHATGNWSALYFESIGRFGDAETCEKEMHKSAAQFRGDMMMKMRKRMPLKDVKFFGTCQFEGFPGNMMFPFEPKKPKDPNTLPQ